MVEPGQDVVDRISGFMGVAIARTQFMNGCVRVGVKARELHDGKPIEEWFDEGDLEVVSKETPKKSAVKATGGPGPAPPTRDCPLH